MGLSETMNTSEPQESYGSYLKADDLRRAVVVSIDKRKVEANASTLGPIMKVGDYGGQVVIPVSVSGIPKRVAATTKGQDFRALKAAFGDDLNGWIGREIQVSADPNLVGLLRVRPADPAGNNGQALPAFPKVEPVFPQTQD